MSDIGMIDHVTDHDELALIRVCGGHGGDIVDCDGDTIMAVAEKDMEAAEKAFQLLVRMYRMGYDHGERWGKRTGQGETRSAILKALGLDHIEARVNAVERNVFPGEFAQ